MRDTRNEFEMPRLSLIIITKNEEAAIERCIRSASAIADEIVVVDSGSTDRTVALARGLGAKVIEPEGWPGYGPQKQRALGAANGEWVLSLDADEWIEGDLAREIENVLNGSPAAGGYRMPRRNRFCGEIVRHGGWWPDHVLRLFRRDRARFSDDPVHERAIVTGTIGTLNHPIEHNTIVNMADAEAKTDRYARLAAEALLANGRTSSLTAARIRGSAAFLRSFVLQLGFLDGETGYRVARYQASYTFKKWAAVASGQPAGKR
jgi:glycosyltransferase involved in cell wall biosynthesis